MKLFVSDYTQNPQNVFYKTAAEIKGLEELKRAAARDHIAVEMKDGHREKNGFIAADCIMLDLDNTHSEDPAEWKTIGDVADAFPAVACYYIQSRNYMKIKKKTAKNGETTYYEAREKYHFYFPLSRTYTSYEEYERLMLTAAGLFPFFDLGAAKPAQFFYGVPKPAGDVIDGSMALDQYIAQQPASAVCEAVNAFTDKMRRGIYKSNPDITKAVRRLFNYFGLSAPLEQPKEQPGGRATDFEEYTRRYASQEALEIARAEQQRSVNWFTEFAQNHEIEIRRTYTISGPDHPEGLCFCVYWPWEAEHSMNGADNEAVVIIDLGGRLSFLCRHSHGGMYSWKDYRAYYENRDQDRLIAGWNQYAQQAAQSAPQTVSAAAGGESPAGTAQSPQNGAQAPTMEAGALPGLLTYSDAVSIFEAADDSTIELKSFPTFSKTAKIKRHDSVVIAADTGVGKSSLAINFLNDLNADYPCIYLNLEMDAIDVLRRLAAIHSGIEIDRIEGYKTDEKTAAAVNITLQAITGRKPLQVIQGAYMLETIEDIVSKSTEGRAEPTMVFIDHSLLVDTKSSTGGRYDRFTQISEGLRKMALRYNIVLFVLLQQNRAGKADENERPKNSSLKESGSWENDATQICFLWYDPDVRRKKLLLTKNRHGSGGEFPLNYWQKTQTYTEAAEGTPGAPPAGSTAPRKPSKRERQQQKLISAYNDAYIATFGQPTIRAMAEAADVTTSTIKSWIKEYGGCMVDGKPIDPAGIDAVVEYTDFVKLTPAENSENPFEKTEQGKPTAGQMKIERY